VVADGDGRHIATLASIGTFDVEMVRTFLVNALDKAGKPYESSDPWELLSAGELEGAEAAFRQMASREGRYGLCRLAALRGDHQKAVELASTLAENDGPFRDGALVQKGVSLMRLGRFAEARDTLEQIDERIEGRAAAEATYYLGCLLGRAQKPDNARVCWRRLRGEPEGTPFAVKAKARLAWPELMAMYENLAATRLPVRASGTEVPVAESGERELIERAIDYLLGQQTADGRWRQGAADVWDAGVTALVAHSLLLWSDQCTGERGQRVQQAVEKATLWLGRYLDRANPPTACSFGTAYTLDFFLEQSERNPAYRERAQRAVRLLLGGQCPNGAWSYNRHFDANWEGGFGGWPRTDRGRTHSMNTGLALLVLARAEALGLDVDAQALERAVAVLLKMRPRVGVFTYTYPEPLNFMEPNQSIGRAAVCEHALLLLGASERSDLEKTLGYFMRYRAGLREPVKLTESWASSIRSGSYFYFFGYYHAGRALQELGGQSAREQLAELRRDMLRVAEVDGTWVDYVEIGKPYGTAMALMVLRIAGQAG
jgi:tetratricopeptide (TPR) repeat protein